MDDATRRALAERLGFNPESATEEQVNAEIERLRSAAPSGDAGQGSPASGQQGTGQSDETPESRPPGDPGTAQYPPVGSGPATTPPPEPAKPPGATTDEGPVEASGAVTLDRATYDRLIQGANLAVGHETERQTQRRDERIDAAIAEGKFEPARRGHYETLWASDPAGTEALITKLAPGLIPVALRERGSGGNENNGVGNMTEEGLPDDWFGKELQQIRAGQIPGSMGGRRIMNAKEG